MSETGATGGRTFLEDLSRDLSLTADLLARYAERDAERREAAARELVTAEQVRALAAARQLRSDVFGMDLANPGWSLLLELFRASLERRPVRLPRLAADAGVSATSAARWVRELAASGFVQRMADPRRPGTGTLILTDAGAEAMEDYFVAVQLGWQKRAAP
ncbi:MAG: MarR family transcriptional regulator [Alphaproteobacteria bacterium]|nr:MarR family transcriptional regulator [Alphaproteobacteria bacterium]